MNASRERSFGCISPVKQNPRRPVRQHGKPQRPAARLMHHQGPPPGGRSAGAGHAGHPAASPRLRAKLLDRRLDSATPGSPAARSFFTGARFAGAKVGFNDARFSGAEIVFDLSEFSEGTVDFTGAQFSGGTVDFLTAQFSGGEVDFSGAGDWSSPPAFSWGRTGTPARGVKLPKKEDQTGGQEQAPTGCSTVSFWTWQAGCSPGDQKAGHVLLQEDAHRHRRGPQAGSRYSDPREGGQVIDGRSASTLRGT
jgi:hypothetical protein